MKLRGQITVFLSMTLLLIISLMAGLIESARMAGAVWYMKASADSAMASVFSQYHRQLWEEYRLLFIEAEDKDELSGMWRTYMKPYEEIHGWYPFAVENTEIKRLDYAVDSGGEYVRQEILDYMRYGLFDLDQDPEHAKALLADLTECTAIDRISSSYEYHSKEAVKLEQALEDIGQSLYVQNELYQSAQSELAGWNGSGFRHEAGRLRTEMKRLTKLVEAYKKKADALAGRISNTEDMLSEEKKQLKVHTKEVMDEYSNAYLSYTEKDGIRRKEIEGLISIRDANLQILEQAVQRSDEVEEEIDSWEESEEDGSGPDKEALWEDVENIWRGIEISGLSFRPGVQDKERQNILERIGRLADEGLLAAVMPEGKTISQGMIDSRHIPSVLYAEEASSPDRLTDRILVDEYCSRFFANALSEPDREFLYEQEYLICGGLTDRENLAQTAKMLLGIREGSNLLHILSNQEKRDEARALAYVIAGVAGAAPLADILTFFVMAVWALGEALVDVKTLLEGGKVPLIKSREDWKLSLDGLLQMGDQGTVSAQGESDGASYSDYLKLLIFTAKQKDLYYRIMDIIQICIQRKEPEFDMAACVYRLDIQAQISGRHLFFGGSEGTYITSILSEKAY